MFNYKMHLTDVVNKNAAMRSLLWLFYVTSFDRVQSEIFENLSSVALRSIQAVRFKQVPRSDSSPPESEIDLALHPSKSSKWSRKKKQTFIGVTPEVVSRSSSSRSRSSSSRSFRDDVSNARRRALEAFKKIFLLEAAAHVLKDLTVDRLMDAQRLFAQSSDVAFAMASTLCDKSEDLFLGFNPDLNYAMEVVFRIARSNPLHLPAKLELELGTQIASIEQRQLLERVQTFRDMWHQHFFPALSSHYLSTSRSLIAFLNSDVRQLLSLDILFVQKVWALSGENFELALEAVKKGGSGTVLHLLHEAGIRGVDCLAPPLALVVFRVLATKFLEFPWESVMSMSKAKEEHFIALETFVLGISRTAGGLAKFSAKGGSPPFFSTLGMLFDLTIGAVAGILAGASPLAPVAILVGPTVAKTTNVFRTFFLTEKLLEIDLNLLPGAENVIAALFPEKVATQVSEAVKTYGKYDIFNYISGSGFDEEIRRQIAESASHNLEQMLYEIRQIPDERVAVETRRSQGFNVTTKITNLGHTIFSDLARPLRHV